MEENMAIEVVGYLNSMFPTVTLDDEDFSVIVSEIRLLPDYGIALESAQRLVRTNDRFPSIAEFRAQYKAIAETKRLDDRPALDPGPRLKIPVWVFVWFWARNGREPTERRSFPHQREGLADEPFLSDTEYAALEAEWRAAGSPAFRNIGEILPVL